jgi:hypothetical protein
MAKVSPRINCKEMQSGTDDGRKRQNVFNPNLFTDDYSRCLKDKNMASKVRNISSHEFRDREMSVRSVTQSRAVNDLVAKKVSPQRDRFSRSLDAKALCEVAERVPLPYTFGIYAQG